MTNAPPLGLGGEADPDAWHFSRPGEVGPLPNPTGHTFPLLTHDSDGRWRLIGTGFYINDSGFFVTARHVVEDVLRDGKQILPLIILQFRSDSGLFGPTECSFRPIRQCWLGESADVALGVAATGTHSVTGEIMKNWTWTLSWSVPPNGAVAATYAFPNHAMLDEGRRFRFAPDSYIGRIQQSGDFLDSVMTPYPYLQVDSRIHGAASGGPIVSAGHVVGINCTEFPLNLDHPPGPGFGAQSRCLADAFFDDIILPRETKPRRVTLDELIQVGCVNIVKYIARNPDRPCRGILVRLDMPVTAPLPAIDITIYA